MKKSNLIYIGAQRKSAGYDLYLPDNFNGALIYFIHGYKGYKNWGAWDLIADFFYSKGFGFAKCNLSHNGTSVHVPNEFTDLDAFAENRYTYELEDMESFIDTVDKTIDKPIRSRVLIGHSRGGGDAILIANQLKYINVLITWAAICDVGNRFLKGDALKTWESEGVYSVLNGRTKQQMPHKYSFYQDYMTNRDKLDITKAAQTIDLPWAIFHGTNDTSVTISEGEQLQRVSKGAKLIPIEGANHVFGAKEPYLSSTLPPHTSELIVKTLNFINSNI